MAKKQTLTQRIALDGGKEIEKELKALGEVGEAAFKKLVDGADKLSNAGTGLNKFFTNLKRDLTAISSGAKNVRDGFFVMADGAVRLARNVALVQAAVAGAATALFLLTKASSDFVDEQNKAAQAAGLSLKEYGRLQFAFEQGNVAAEAFGVSMKKFNVTLNDAVTNGGKSAALFKNLGVSIKDAAGNVRPTGAILADLADKFAAMPDGAKKSALAVQLFGKAGAAIVPVLNEGGKALNKLGDDAERVGRVFTDNQAKIGDAFGDALNEMNSTINGIRIAIGLLLAPAFTEAFKGITALILENKNALLAFGQTLADQVVPLIKDFVNLLKGDDAAVVNKNLLAVRDTFLSIVSAVQLVGAIISTVFDVLAAAIQPVLDLINAVFGTKLEGRAVIITLIIGQLLGVFRLLGAAVKGSQLLFAGLAEIFGTVTAQVAAIIARALLLQGLLKVLVDDIIATVKDVAGGIGQIISDLVAQVTGFFADMGKAITDVFQGVFDFLQNLIKMAGDAIKAVGDAITGGGGKPDSPQKNARGGPIRGRGTGTSDSILSWLSNGEFVVRAKAVRKWGVNALNRLNAGIPAFASGGLAMPRSSPSFALGGNGGGDSPPKSFDLHIGDEIFEGLLAPATVASKLVQFAKTRNVRSGGTKPTWER